MKAFSYTRTVIGVLLVAGLVVTIGLAFSEPFEPNIRALWDGPNPRFFIRQPDTTCAAASDTLVGPSVYCFGARQVIWNIRANSGTCSTFTIQVSNNDSTWRSSTILTQTQTDFTVGDSLNTGGVSIALLPTDLVDGAVLGIPWKYCRAFVRRRVGYSPSTASAGPTVACRTRCDSLRWTAYVQWGSP